MIHFDNRDVYGPRIEKRNINGANLWTGHLSIWSVTTHGSGAQHRVHTHKRVLTIEYPLSDRS